ncbi:MAG: hypothetical protein IPF98_22710 [Gemmatimonadetes bacterium]|nr:hypothetical protein [Gemmatimonadota bacterium]
MSLKKIGAASMQKKTRVMNDLVVVRDLLLQLFLDAGLPSLPLPHL